MMPRIQRFELSTNDMLKDHSRAPLDSTVSYHKTLSISYLCLAQNPLEIDDEDLDLLKMDHLS